MDEAEMKILAGTSGGIFDIQDGDCNQLVDSPNVRDLFHYDGRLFAGTGAGLFVSDNKGKVWIQSGLEEYEVWQIRSASDGVIYASTSPASLFCSEDKGTNWIEVTSFTNHPEASKWLIPVNPPISGRSRALVIDQCNPDRIWVGVEVGGIMQSDDRGKTWSLNLPGDNPDLHMMYAQPGQANTLFASTGYGRPDGIAEMIEGNAGVFRSDDGGANWQYAWKGITPRYSRPMCIDHRPPYGLTVACAPTAFSSYKDKGGAGAMLMRSEDKGNSWRSLCDEAHSPSRGNIHGLAIDREHVGGVIIGTDDGEVWRITDDAKWTLLADKLPAVLSAIAI
jgi:photosystem II stability/assembly factor-like uncharacterized protein